MKYVPGMMIRPRERMLNKIPGRDELGLILYKAPFSVSEPEIPETFLLLNEIATIISSNGSSTTELYILGPHGFGYVFSAWIQEA